MSHFTVLVMGNDPEKLLAPFDEGIQTEPRDDGNIDLEKLIKFYAEAAEDKEYHGDFMSKAQEIKDGKPERALNDYHGEGGWRRREDGTYVQVTRYNPNSKWDWYSLGGRWRGSLKVTPEAWDRVTKKQTPGLGEISWTLSPEWNGGKVHTDDAMWVDQCRRGDLDLQGMIDKKVAMGRSAVAELMDFISEYGNPPDASWIDAGLEGDELRSARDAYWAHPWMKTNAQLAQDNRESKATVGSFGYWDLNDFRLVTENADGRDRFLELQAQRAVPGYAFLDEQHGWVEPGEMGWWGMSSATPESRVKYYAERLAALTSLSDDVLVSVYDCHI
jgi:hypothetical protein